MWTPNSTPGPSTLQVPNASGGSPWPASRPAPSSGPAPSTGGSGSPPYPQWTSRDPRTSSTQSLVPSSSSAADHRRTLLVVYIHGFMGNNSSFRSFPAHVHAFLKYLLAETHVIHTKIYPRYKTYNSIELACENFSKWLAPHESPTTDVILVGHSMGGLLAADVVLLPSQGPYHTSSPFRHRILGTVSLDAPLLGLHPGIVVSGIASLFRPSPSPPVMGTQTEYFQSQKLSPDSSTYSEVLPPARPVSPSLTPYPSSSAMTSPAAEPDPLFNPPFFNDVAFIDRGWVKNIIHFAKKHKEENIISAAANHILSHLEFSACLANYPELRSRYNRLRALEDVDNWDHATGGQRPVRVRFVNYYTVSTGVIKKPRSPSPSPSRSPNHTDESREPHKSPPDNDLLLTAPKVSDEKAYVPTPRTSVEESRVSTPKISVEEYGNEGRRAIFQELEPIPDPETEPSKPPCALESAQQDLSAEPTTVDYNSFTEEEEKEYLRPPIPALPSPPTPPDLDACPDKESRKQAEKDFQRLEKEHTQLRKDREKEIKRREKAVEAHRKAIEKKKRKELKLKEKALRAEEKALKAQQKAAKLHKPPPPPLPPPQQGFHHDEHEKSPSETLPPRSSRSRSTERNQDKKPPRRRKFCMLPPKSEAGARDPTWIEVYMEGVDEVGAHCGLFLPGPHYERLVGDVGERIAGWVWEEASRRVALEDGELHDG
ncbi:hypothetical protein VTI74DRAFT_9894 [Chaetomium olivicolor]